MPASPMCVGRGCGVRNVVPLYSSKRGCYVVLHRNAIIAYPKSSCVKHTGKHIGPITYAPYLCGDQFAIARTLQGNVEAFNELVLTYQRLAFSVAFRILQSKEAAEDVVQDSFIKAFCALHAFHGGLFKSCCCASSSTTAMTTFAALVVFVVTCAAKLALMTTILKKDHIFLSNPSIPTNRHRHLLNVWS